MAIPRCKSLEECRTAAFERDESGRLRSSEILAQALILLERSGERGLSERLFEANEVAQGLYRKALSAPEGSGAREYLERLEAWRARVEDGGGSWKVVNDLDRVEIERVADVFEAQGK